MEHFDDLVNEETITDWEKEDQENLTNEKRAGKEDIQLRVIKANYDYNIDYLVQSIGKNIYLGPFYQRRSRWSTKQKSLLIESLLMNIPIPPIFLFEKSEYHEYEVVDGRQRLEAINDFYSDSFNLKDLEYLSNLNGKKYKDLDQSTKRQLVRRTISATVLMAESKGFEEVDVRMILFDRLNTGGIKLNAQELRNAVYSGKFNDFLVELAENEVFRKIWGIPILTQDEKKDKRIKKKLKNNTLYKSMMDVELVLRFFAIQNVMRDKVTGSMKKLLDETMKKYRNANSDLIAEKKNDFLRCINGLYTIFGSETFANPRLDNRGKARNLYDSLMVAFSNIKDEDLLENKVIKRNLVKALNDEDNYEKIISKGNTIENIKFRVKKAEEILTQE